MNDAQTLFSIFFGIYFAIVSSLSGVLQPFDTPSMYYMVWKAWLRFLISILILNIIPILYFVYIYNFLDDIISLQISFLPILFIFSLSIVYFGFYRIYFGVMILKINKKYLFYEEGGLPTILKDSLKDRGKRHTNPCAHIIPGFIWIIVSHYLGYLGLKYFI